ncbi:MAG: glycosyltransferase [Woeseiaceae bacterium]|nr:glycosyltransferase [Woeseiaceae bacterium]
MSVSSSENRPVFSFVVPAFNEEAYIEKTLRDIHAAFTPESRSEYEILLVDNGSTDRTPEIAESLGCTVLIEPTLGISELRNHGARRSRGDIIVFIDADVSLTPEWRRDVEPFIAPLRAGARELVGSHYQPSRATPLPLIKWFEGSYQNPRSTFLPGGHTILARDAFEEIGGFDPAFSTSEDIDFCHRATAKGFDVRHCPEVGVVHMGDPRSVRQFLKRECWHGGSDFESIPRMLTSRTAWATLFFVAMHVALVLLLASGELALALLPVAGIAALLLATSTHLFPRSSIGLRLINAANAYLSYLGRCCSIRALFVKSRRD